jgi:hypothetical protein
MPDRCQPPIDRGLMIVLMPARLALRIKEHTRRTYKKIYDSPVRSEEKG